MMARTIAVAVVTIGLAAAVAAPAFPAAQWELGDDTPAERTVHRANALLEEEAPFPDDFDRRMEAGQVPGDFDPQRFFDVFSHLTMEEGYTLGYLYVFDYLGGEPYLAAVPEGEESARFFLADREEPPIGPRDGLRLVRTDGSNEGFLELALLQIMGVQFYRFWHSGFYDWLPVCGPESLENLLGSLKSDDPDDVNWTWEGRYGVTLDRARPKTEIADDGATVTLLAFSQNGGLYEFRFEFSRDFPHEVREVELDLLIPFDAQATWYPDTTP